ncbi:hypothetical protein [Streptomyces sp. SS8]
MPYLGGGGRTHRPDQTPANRSFYEYDLAEVVMVEGDGSTSYRPLAKALADALLTLADMRAHLPAANAVLDAMPDGRWAGDPGPQVLRCDSRSRRTRR